MACLDQWALRDLKDHLDQRVTVDGTESLVSPEVPLQPADQVHLGMSDSQDLLEKMGDLDRRATVVPRAQGVNLDLSDCLVLTGNRDQRAKGDYQERKETLALVDQRGLKEFLVNRACLVSSANQVQRVTEATKAFRVLRELQVQLE